MDHLRTLCSGNFSAIKVSLFISPLCCKLQYHLLHLGSNLQALVRKSDLLIPSPQDSIWVFQSCLQPAINLLQKLLKNTLSKASSFHTWHETAFLNMSKCIFMK